MIKNKKRRIKVFSFGPVTYDAVLKKVKKQSDILTKILKQNWDYFAYYFYKNSMQISKLVFPSDWKLADLTTVYKKKLKIPKDNLGQLAYYPTFPKFA